MSEFPKKYNRQQNTEANPFLPEEKVPQIQLLSSLFPLEQDFTLGHCFWVCIQDVISKCIIMKWNDVHQHTAFRFSSLLHMILTWWKEEKRQDQESKSLLFKKRNTKWLNLFDIGNEDTTIVWEWYSRLLRKVFDDLYAEKKIIEQREVISRSTSLQTNVPQEQIQYEKKKWKKYVIRYFVDTKNDTLLVTTTSPQTIFWDVALAVHPEDKRYKKMIGKKVIIPIINKVIPIIGDPSVETLTETGVQRVTPWHDKWWYEIAKKHNLETDVYAIDEKWYFTTLGNEFAWKKVEDFLENIVQYIEDIWNMESIKTVEYEVPVFKKTGEEIFPLLKSQWFITVDYTKDIIDQCLSNREIKIYPEVYMNEIQEWINATSLVNVSNGIPNGISLPLWTSKRGKTLLLTERIILEYYRQKRSKKNILFTLVIFNLIADWCLWQYFSTDEITNVLFMPSKEGDKTKLERYIEIFTEAVEDDKSYKVYKSEIKDLEKILWWLDKNNKTAQQKFHTLLEMLEKSFLIEKTGRSYHISLEEIVCREKEITQLPYYFDQQYIDALQAIYTLRLEKKDDFKKIETYDAFKIESSDNVNTVVNSLLCTVEYAKTIPYKQIYIHQQLVDEKNKKLSILQNKFLAQETKELKDMYGPDVLRLFLLWSGDDEKSGVCDIHTIYAYQRFVEQLWNAVRFVSIKYGEEYKRGINLKKIAWEVIKNPENLTPFDVWMLHVMKELVDDMESYILSWRICEYTKKIMHVVQHLFCNQYLETIKVNNSEDTPKVATIVVGMILQIFYPFLPRLSKLLLELCDYKHEGLDLFALHTKELPQKNYRVILLIEIMGKIYDLKEKNDIKKHETVDLFVQATPDFLEFMQQHENMVNALTKIRTIKYIKLHESPLDWFIVDMVVNITLGIKHVPWEIKKVDEKVDYKQIVEEKKAHLQFLRNIIWTLSQQVGVDVEEKVKQKKKEFEKTKKEIEELEYQLSKSKIKD